MRKNYLLLIGLLLILSVTRELLAGNPQDIGAAYWFRKAVSEKDTDKKIEFYLKAIQENPAFAEAHYNLALLYIGKKEIGKAVDHLNQALTSDPNPSLKSNVLSRLGASYRKLGQLVEAEKAFNEAMKLSKDTQFKNLMLYELGQTKISQGRYAEAIEYFRKGLLNSPENRSSFELGIQMAREQQKVAELYEQGLALIKNNKLTDAKEVFRQLLQMDSSHAGAKEQLEKIADLMAQKVDPRDQQIQPLYIQALADMNQGKWSEAIKNLEKIKSLRPNNAEIAKLLAEAQEKQNEQILNEQKIENFYTMGVENFTKGNYTLALANFEKVAELNPNYKDIDSRIQATRKEVNRINELMSRMPTRDEVVVSEPVESYAMESNFSPGSNAGAMRSSSESGMKSDADIDQELAQTYYQQALDLMRQQDWQRAMILLEKIKLIKPGYRNTEFLLSQARQNIESTMGLSQDATSGRTAGNKLILALIIGFVSLPLAILYLLPTTRARYYILLKRYDKARAIYERLLSKKPNNIKLYITLANIYINENRIDEVAIRVFERAIQYNDHLKLQLEPIVSRYYLQKSKVSDSPKKLIDGILAEELNRMGK
ncbi:MAG: tetratricopeptide repeat protein [candidate division KSB1 bacterium]|nr:tetratricopeptide repeat protein [candidate division KSB1 bacterium]MDZ7358542.1 tetratricopeptide repeat protein [candidate division KSB1 bacterium]